LDSGKTAEEESYILHERDNRKTHRSKKANICMFIDYTKAFDRVQHKQLIKCLKDDADIRLICNLYWEQTASIRYNRDISAPNNIKRGVRQGCVLSPCLFNLYTENIFKHIKEIPGLNINGNIINNLRYADDTVLLAENPEELQHLVKEVSMKSREYGLEMNIKKTKTMVINKDNTQNLHINIKVDDMDLEEVQEYIYLGHNITSDGKCDKEINKRIGMAKNVFNNMKHILTSKQITSELKLRTIKCYIYSAFLYGAETWTLNKKTEKKIEALEMGIYRKRVKWSEKKTNKEVLKLLKMMSRFSRAGLGRWRNITV
jgi:hypothetical protein